MNDNTTTRQHDNCEVSSKNSDGLRSPFGAFSFAARIISTKIAILVLVFSFLCIFSAANLHAQFGWGSISPFSVTINGAPSPQGQLYFDPPNETIKVTADASGTNVTQQDMLMSFDDYIRELDEPPYLVRIHILQEVTVEPDDSYSFAVTDVEITPSVESTYQVLEGGAHLHMETLPGVELSCFSRKWNFWNLG